MLEIDITANQTLDAMVVVCNVQVVTYKFESGGYTLEAVDLETFEQFTIHTDTLMDTVIELGKLMVVSRVPSHEP